VAERVFPFLQVEMPFELGVPDGRWMVREQGSTQVQRVVVLASVAARRAEPRQRGRQGSRQPPQAEAPQAEAPQAPVTRATLVAAQPLAGEVAAQAWLHAIDSEQEIDSAFEALNRLLAAHRIAAADPYAHEVAPSQALALRAGFGRGEQVAEGRWLQARELRLPRAPRWRRGRRAAILRSQERLASLLSSQRGALLCEELALRARLDLDLGRIAHAAGELDRALSLAVVELQGEPGQNLPLRVNELRKLGKDVGEIAQRTLDAALAARALTTPPAPDPQDAETLAAALARLEAALRARAMALTWR
jgi:hypothetical protein